MSNSVPPPCQNSAGLQRTCANSGAQKDALTSAIVTRLCRGKVCTVVPKLRTRVRFPSPALSERPGQAADSAERGSPYGPRGAFPCHIRATTERGSRASPRASLIYQHATEERDKAIAEALSEQISRSTEGLRRR